MLFLYTKNLKFRNWDHIFIMYNLDETGLTTVHNPPNVLSQKGMKQVGQVTSGESGISLVCCFSFINAIGNTLSRFMS